jgi:hypothetical protein
MKTTFVILTVLLISTSCKKEKINPDAGTNVEFYLIDNYTTDQLDMPINEDSATLNDTVLISYSEIISYNSKTYEFKVSEEVLERLNYYQAFAVTVDKEIIYTGYFWASFSSLIVNWVVIDILFTENNMLHVQLGYPGLLEGMSIPDRRNDTRILDVMQRDNKLIE